MNRFKECEAFFLLKGSCGEVGQLCEKYKLLQNSSVVVTDNKITMSSKSHVMSDSVSVHIAWLIQQLENDMSLIKAAVEQGAVISFTYFYHRERVMGDILEASISGCLYELNAPLHIHQRAGFDE